MNPQEVPTGCFLGLFFNLKYVSRLSCWKKENQFTPFQLNHQYIVQNNPDPSFINVAASPQYYILHHFLHTFSSASDWGQKFFSSNAMWLIVFQSGEMLHSLTEKSDSNVALLPECKGSVGGRHCGWGTWLRGTCLERGNMVEEHHWTETGELYTESLRYSLIQKKKR